MNTSSGGREIKMANNTLNMTGPHIEEAIKLDNYSSLELLIGSVLTVVFCGFGTVAVISLNRTKTTPKSARFLSSALISFDIMAVISFAVRKFVTDHTLNVVIQTVGVVAALLAYVTVGLMSLERLLIFCAPNLYLRRASPELVKKFAYTVWIAVTCSYFFVRYGVCYFMFDDVIILDVIGRCNQASFIFYGFFLVSTIIISFMCYFKILSILRSQSNVDSSIDFTPLKSIDFYRSTSLVFAYIVTITILTLAYAVMLLLGLSTEPLRIMTDVINMVQCVMDPCMYILWYRETRMEMLKIMSKLHPCFAARVEAMRMEIFNIVTSEFKPHIFNNRVHPLEESKTQPIVETVG